MTNHLYAAEKALLAFLHGYLVERNIQKTINSVTNDLYSIGSGIQETACNKEEFRALLTAEITQDPCPYTYQFLQMHSKQVSDTYFVFSAQLLITRESAAQPEISVPTRFMAGMRLEDGIFKASLLNMSIACNLQEENEFYPTQMGRLTIKQLNQLKTELLEKSFQLINSSILGGMMGGYYEADFPFYFINQQMLSYLGYGTEEEFCTRNNNKIINCIHPSDRDYVSNTVHEAFRHGEVYEVTYRMQKKDDAYIWVQDRGRLVIAENGRPAIISVCLDITESLKMQEALEAQSESLAEKNNELEQFYNTVFSGVSKIAYDPSLSFLYANDRFYSMLGYTCGDFPNAMGQIIPKKYQDELSRLFARAIAHKRPISHKLQMIKKDGACLWVRIDASLSKEYFQGFPVFYCIYTDIDDEQEQEAEIRRQKYFTSLVLSSSTAGTVIVYPDQAYSFAYVGDNFIHFLGYERREFERKFRNYLEICHPEDTTPLKQNVQNQLKRSDHYEVEHRLQKKDGNYIWVLEKGKKTIDEDGREILVCILLDHSLQKMAKDYLLETSRLDSLTQVLNRRAAKSEINRYLHAQHKNLSPARYTALFLLDVDNFKKVNDTFGHVMGDKVLIELSRHLSASFRRNDLVARLGGDEFIAFMKEVETLSDIEQKGKAICKMYAEKYKSCFGDFSLTISMGIAVIKDTKTDFDTLYHTADVALYQAKCQGKNTFVLQEL